MYYKRQRITQVGLMLEILLRERIHIQNTIKIINASGKLYFSKLENKKFCHLADFLKDKGNTGMPHQCYLM